MLQWPVARNGKVPHNFSREPMLAQFPSGWSNNLEFPGEAGMAVVSDKTGFKSNWSARSGLLN